MESTSAGLEVWAAVVDPAHDAADLATLLDDVAAAADAIAAG